MENAYFHAVSGAYVLAELDGTVFVKPFAARRLKLYHFRDIKVPIVQEEWQTNVEDLDIMDEYIEEDEDEYANVPSVNVARARAKRIIRARESPKLPHPWELRGKQCNEYWQKVLEDWMSGETAKRLSEGCPSDWQRAIDEWNKEDAQFWNFRWDFKDFDIEDIPRWKNQGPSRPELFIWKRGNEWLPSGPPVYEAQTATLINAPAGMRDIALLGTPRITAIPTNAFTCDSTNSTEGSDIKNSEFSSEEDNSLLVEFIQNVMREYRRRRSADHWSLHSSPRRSPRPQRTNRRRSPIVIRNRSPSDILSDIPAKDEYSHTAENTESTFANITKAQQDYLANVSVALEGCANSVSTAQTQYDEGVKLIQGKLETMNDSLLRIVQQFADENEKFRRTKRIIDSTFSSATLNIRETLEQVDNLSIFLTKVKENELDTGDYIRVYERLARQITAHIQKTYECRESDLSALGHNFEKIKDILYHIDPSAKSVIDWQAKGKEVRNAEKAKLEDEHAQREMSAAKAKEMKKMLDEVHSSSSRPSEQKKKLKLKPNKKC